jgi:hypothetical protein
MAELLGPGCTQNAGGVFTTSTGLHFTLKSEQSDVDFLVRPEVLMTVIAADLSGQMVFRLLAVQSLLMREMNWWLSASDTGQLQLSPIQWHTEPATVAACIDLAAVLMPSVMKFILTGEPAPLQ